MSFTMVYDVIQNLEKFGQHIFQNLKSTNQKTFFQFLFRKSLKYFWMEAQKRKKCESLCVVNGFQILN